MSKRGLGKGINSLIGDYSFDDIVENTTERRDFVEELSLEKIKANPGQPRKSFDREALEELADSVKNQGVIQPIIVERQHDGYIVVAGERRYRAAKLAGLETVPSIVKNFTEGQRLEVALIENIQRENLNPLEEAKAYRYLIDKTNMSQQNLADRVGKKRSTVANSLRLLNLPTQVQNALISKTISAGHARALMSVVNPSEQVVLLNRIITEHLSVRQSEDIAKQLNNGSRAAKKKKAKRSQARSAELTSVEEKFLDACGSKVHIKGTLNKGSVEISFYSPDDLQRIYSLITNKEDLFE